MQDSQDKNIHILYKKLGDTPLQTLSDFKENNPEYESVPMTYAGRLDPMAEGLLLLLSGELVHKKGEYTSLSKQYECEVLWGIETDTLDILGIVHKTNDLMPPIAQDVKETLQSFVGKFKQKYPAYSSQTVGGKSLIEWSRESRIHEITIPSHTVEMEHAQYISRRYMSALELKNEITRRVALVSGDFRQEEITASWEKTIIENPEKMFTIDSFSIGVSGGFYVRQLVSDMAEKLNTSAVTFHIKRTQVGEFTIQ